MTAISDPKAALVSNVTSSQEKATMENPSRPHRYAVGTMVLGSRCSLKSTRESTIAVTTNTDQVAKWARPMRVFCPSMSMPGFCLRSPNYSRVAIRLWITCSTGRPA